MPIFEYECKSCSNQFEELVSSRETAVVCPSCNSTDTRKLMSVFAASNSGGGAVPSCYSPGCGSSGFS